MRGWFLLGLFLVCLDQSATQVVGMDTDFWWHLAAGQRFFEHGLELNDPYSFTYADAPWIRIDWLFQVLSYAVYKLGGWPGILLTRSLLLLGSTWLILKMARDQHSSWGVSGLVALLTLSIWSASVPLRPATVSIFFTTLLLWLLEQARRGQPHRLKWTAPLILVWFNFHVAALGGCLLLGLYAWAHLWDSRIFKRLPLDPGWLWAVLLGALAVFVNPQGWKVVYLPIHFLWVKSIWSEVILEVQRPDLNWAGTLQCRILLLAALWASWKFWKEKSSHGLWLTLAFGFLTFSVYRHQFQFCVILACVGARSFQELRNRLATTPTRIVTGLLLLPAAVWSSCHLWTSKLPLQGLIRRETFAENVAQLAATGPEGLRIFTDMNSAGYYIWETGGRQKIFIDARGEQVYVHPEFMNSYFEILLAGKQSLALLEQHRVQAIAVNALSMGQAPLLQLLSANASNWVLLYRDNTGAWYCRPELQQHWRTVPLPPEYLGEFNRGQQLLREGKGREAEDAFRRSLQLYPQFASAHQGLARALMQQEGATAASIQRALARAELFNPATPGLDEDWSRLGIGQAAWMRKLWLPFRAL